MEEDAELDHWKAVLDAAERGAREESRRQGELDAVRRECRERYGTDDPDKLQRLGEKMGKELERNRQELNDLTGRLEQGYGGKLRKAE